jgi:hypothetical protein
MKHGMRYLNVLLAFIMGVESVFLFARALRPTHHLPIWFAVFSLYILASAITFVLMHRKFRAIESNPECRSIARSNHNAKIFWGISIGIFLAADLALIIATW